MNKAKSYLLVFLTLAVVTVNITSCKSTLDSEIKIDKPVIEDTKNVTETIKVPVCFSSRQNNETDAIVNEILKDKYNLTIEYNRKPVVSEADIANFDGLVLIGYKEFFDYFPNRAKSMLPMTEFLSEIEGWKTCPDFIRQAFCQYDGENWALPLYAQAHEPFPVRVYNGDILDSLGLKKPGSIEDFTSMLEKVKENYPDVKPMMVSGNSILYYCSDVLRAFGVPVYSYGNTFSQIVYDKRAGGYVDVVMSERFMTALTYLKDLYSMNLMDITDYYENTMYKLFNGRMYFSLYGRFPVSDDMISTDFNTEYSSFLMKDDAELQQIFLDDSFMVAVLGGATEDPGKILDAFVSSFYIDESGIRDVSYGLKELVGYEMPDGNILTPEYSQGVKFLPMDTSALLDVPEFNIAFNNEKSLRITQEIKADYMNSVPGYSQPYSNDFFHAYISLYTKQKEDMANSLNNLVMEYLQNDISNEDFMDNYLKQMNDLDAEGIINSNNNQWGLVEFSYDE